MMPEVKAWPLDGYGHIESHTFLDGAIAGVMERDGGARIVLSLNGDPLKGYDRVWWYASVDDARDALQGWDYPDDFEPPFHIRDCLVNPVED